MLDAGAHPARNDLDIYDAVAGDWWSGRTRWIRTLGNMVPARLNYFDGFIDWPGKKVLDLGCAGGFMAEALAQRGAHVTGIDPAEKVIGVARTHAASAGLDIRYDVGVGEDLPYEAETFDAIVCVDVLEHVEDLARVIKESARVLKPNGFFLFDTINRTLLARFVVVTLAERVLGLLPRGTHDPGLFIRPSTLRRVLEQNGFAVGAFTGLAPRWFDRRGDFTFGRAPLTAVIYMGTARRKC